MTCLLGCLADIYGHFEELTASIIRMVIVLMTDYTVTISHKTYSALYTCLHTRAEFSINNIYVWK